MNCYSCSTGRLCSCEIRAEIAHGRHVRAVEGAPGLSVRRFFRQSVACRSVRCHDQGDTPLPFSWRGFTRVRLQGFPAGGNKVRPTSGLALFAYQVLNANEVVHLLPVDRLANERAAGDASGANVKGEETPNSRATKVLHVKNGSTSEVRRPAGICMSVMSTVFCRKVPLVLI